MIEPAGTKGTPTVTTLRRRLTTPPATWRAEILTCAALLGGLLGLLNGWG
jgi:hypothetical protein